MIKSLRVILKMLRFEKYKMDGVDLGPESSLPLLPNFYIKIDATKTDIDESEGLFIGEGYVNSAFPYKNLDNYNRDLKEKDFPCAIKQVAGSWSLRIQS